MIISKTIRICRFVKCNFERKTSTPGFEPVIRIRKSWVLNKIRIRRGFFNEGTKLKENNSFLCFKNTVFHNHRDTLEQFSNESDKLRYLLYFYKFVRLILNLFDIKKTIFCFALKIQLSTIIGIPFSLIIKTTNYAICLIFFFFNSNSFV